MRHLHFLIFLAILSALAGVLFGSRQYIFNFYEKAVASNLQTKLLSLQLNEAERLIKFSQEKPITLLFVGDIMLSRGVANQIEKHQDYDWPFLKISTTTQEADLTFGNLEGPISSRGENQGSMYSFRTSPELVEGLKFAGFDILSLANNHIWDYGKEALEDTIAMLKHSGIETIGAGENYEKANAPVIIDFNSTLRGSTSSQIREVEPRIAFLAYTNLYPKSLEATENSAGISSFELEKVKTDIQELKALKLADIIIVSFHWGEEYQDRSNPSQQEIAHSLIDAGADLIIGHHPHVIQEVEEYLSSPIALEGQGPPSPKASARRGWAAYSLGNFVFDQNFSKETTEGLMLKVIVKNSAQGGSLPVRQAGASGGKKISEVLPIKIKINSAFQPEIIEL